MLTDQGKNIRIIKLPDSDEIQPGYYVPVDSVVDGTKKFDLSGLTTAIEGKADASEIEGLQEEIASKAGPEEIEALEIEIEGKASQDDLVTLSGTVDQLKDDVSTAQDDITALQTAVEDLQIIPDTSAASAGDFLSFDGTGLEWTELPDMKVQAGTDIKVEGNVVSVNTNGTVANSADMSFVAGSGTYARGIGSVAFGINTSAIGNRGAFAEGSGTTAAGSFSHAEGLNTKATGDCSHATGIGTEALACAFACGKYNVVDSNDLFTIGNGADASQKSTCFRVDKDGKVWFIYNGVLTDLATTVGLVRNVGQLTDSSQIVAYNLNNGFATLSTSQSALTIVDVVGTNEIVNFAIEITPSVNCTLTIQKKVGTNSPVTLKHSVAAGNTLEANKTYQVTAVGNCWTLAEFEA